MEPMRRRAVRADKHFPLSQSVPHTNMRRPVVRSSGERRRQFLAATASPRSPLGSGGRTGSGGSEREGSPTAAGRQRQQELIPTKSWEKRRSASPPLRLPPQVVPVAARSPEERSPQSEHDERRSWNGQPAAGRAKQQRRPLPPPKVSCAELAVMPLTCASEPASQPVR